MKKPIALNGDNLSSIITAMLMEKGLTEYTLHFDTFTELDLGNWGLEFTAEWSDSGDKSYPESITVTLRKVDDEHR